jgi:hypothetical protein
MNKSDLLRLVRKAKSSHIRWRSYAQALVAGLDVREDNAPIHHQSCQFGRWYYGEGRRLFGRLEIYRDIEVPHEILHHIYERIYQSVAKGRQAEAKSLLDQMVGVSRTLLEALELLEQEIHALVDDETVLPGELMHC